MKRLPKLLLVFISLCSLWLSFSSSKDGVFGVYYSSGPAQSGLDRTGGPLSGGNTCAQCHSGGAYNPAIGIQVLNGTGNPVATYTPGATYNVVFTVSNSAGGAPRFGFQSVALTSTNTNGGNFTISGSPNSQISLFNGRKYVEHQGSSASGVFSYTWVAPSSGTGTITFYSCGNAVNGSGSGGDNVTSAIQFALPEATPTTITYGGNQFCANATDPIPIISGNQGGTFAATPAGLSINPANGTVDLSASTTNQTYTITYTHSGGTATALLKINPTFTLNNAAVICSNDSLFLAGAWRKTAGIYTSNLQTTKGCDSTVTTNLSIKQAYLNQTTTSVCQGDSLLIFGIYRKTAGVYTQNNTTTLGCDSNFVVNFQLKPTFEQTTFYTFCEGDSALVHGQYFKLDTVLIDSNQTTLGCDSVSISVVQKVNIDLSISISGAVLTANQVGASYQWFQCITNMPITGANNQSYSPIANGQYYCVIGLTNCMVQTDCVTLTNVGLSKNYLHEITVSPNPSNGEFIISAKTFGAGSTIQIMDTRGKLIYTTTLYAKETQVSLLVSPGIYFLYHTENGTVGVEKIKIE